MSMSNYSGKEQIPFSYASVCPACGSVDQTNQSGTCSNCGFPLEAAKEMTGCPKCGRTISVYAPVCPACGNQRDVLQILLQKKQGKTAESQSAVQIPAEADKEKTLRCPVCKNEFDLSGQQKCPKCSFPVLTFCGQKTQMKGFVKSYRKQVGIQSLELQVGQHYKMGRYGGEEINWIVLAAEPEKALLISEKALAIQRYHKGFEKTNWGKCTLRKWLNINFSAEAFNKEELDRIVLANVRPDSNPSSSADSGPFTDDHIFLLSIAEAAQYFGTDDDRKAIPAECVKKNAFAGSNTDTCMWWLRTPGSNSYNAAFVDRNGKISQPGISVSNSAVCVRPALWIRLDV